MRLFLAGIIQGSMVEATVHGQDYRQQIKDLLAVHLPQAEVYDPVAGHQNSIEYDDETGRRVFFGHNAMCREIDVLLAVVPEASMGTAVEMWEAYQHGAAVIAISPLAYNWAVRFLSHAIYPTVGAFAEALAAGEVARRIDDVLAR